MIPLNNIISIVVVTIYVPVLILANRIMVSSKDPLRRWRTLLACILCRLAASALFIPYGLLPLLETQVYYTLCFTLDVCSSWALTVCTAYLINIADEGKGTQRGSSSVSGHRDKKSTEALRLPGIMMVIAIIPSVWVIPFVVLDVLSTRSAGVPVALLYVAPFGPIYIALLFITVVGYAVRTWFRFERMLHYRKRLLVLITVILPLIAVRVVYGILNVFSPVTITLTGNYAVNLYTSKLAVFSMFMFEGSPIYLVMDILMECVVVITYTVAGTILPLDEDYRLTDEYPFLRLQYLGDMEDQL